MEIQFNPSQVDIFIPVGIMMGEAKKSIKFLHISFLFLSYMPFILESLKLENPLFTMLFLSLFKFMFSIKLPSLCSMHKITCT